MTYASAGLIQATDFNNFAWGGTQGSYTASPNNIAYVMGTGNAAYGYGQSVTSLNTVSASSTVTATQWSGLVGDLNAALAHQSGAGAQVSPNPSITAGNTITYEANVATAVTTINTNAALYNAQGSTTVGGVTNNGINTTGANDTTYTRTATFSSANHARYFFNAGGTLEFVVSSVDNSGTTRSNTIDALVDSAGGILTFGNTDNGGRSGSGGSVSTNDTTIGHRDLTGSNQVIVQVDATGTYAGDLVQLGAYYSSADTTNGAIASVFHFTCRVYAVTSHSSFNDTLNITVSTSIDVTYPETTYLTDSWGTVSLS